MERNSEFVAHIKWYVKSFISLCVWMENFFIFVLPFKENEKNLKVLINADMHYDLLVCVLMCNL